jgi:histidyl-tRNA synthetase
VRTRSDAWGRILRILDSKDTCDRSAPGCPSILRPPRRWIDKGLHAWTLGTPVRVEPRLVRGLDTTRTLFEIQLNAGDVGRRTLGGGGRYDRLVAELGGGVAIGLRWVPRALPSP